MLKNECKLHDRSSNGTVEAYKKLKFTAVSNWKYTFHTVVFQHFAQNNAQYGIHWLWAVVPASRFREHITLFKSLRTVWEQSCLFFSKEIRGCFCYKWASTAQPTEVKHLWTRWNIPVYSRSSRMSMWILVIVYAEEQGKIKLYLLEFKQLYEDYYICEKTFISFFLNECVLGETRSPDPNRDWIWSLLLNSVFKYIKIKKFFLDWKLFLSFKKTNKQT